MGTEKNSIFSLREKICLGKDWIQRGWILSKGSKVSDLSISCCSFSICLIFPFLLFLLHLGLGCSPPPPTPPHTHTLTDNSCSFQYFPPAELTRAKKSLRREALEETPLKLKTTRIFWWSVLPTLWTHRFFLLFFCFYSYSYSYLYLNLCLYGNLYHKQNEYCIFSGTCHWMCIFLLHLSYKHFSHFWHCLPLSVFWQSGAHSGKKVRCLKLWHMMTAFFSFFCFI